jgi:hypothetical protein
LISIFFLQPKAQSLLPLFTEMPCCSEDTSHHCHFYLIGCMATANAPLGSYFAAAPPILPLTLIRFSGGISS